MSYHVDDAKITLAEFGKELVSMDLIPSHVRVLDGLDGHIRAMKKKGIATLREFRTSVRNTKELSVLASASGVPSDYLSLFKRIAEGFFPKPPRLSDFPGVAPGVVASLGKFGVATAKDLFESASDAKTGRDIAVRAKVPIDAIEELLALSSVTRIQWVGPAWARALVDAGFRSPEAVAKAGIDRLRVAVGTVVPRGGGKAMRLGEKDIARLLLSAAFVVRYS